jgi:DNA end-binding protein Ku
MERATDAWDATPLYAPFVFWSEARKSSARSANEMAARTIWKGTLKLGTDPLPVKLYAAVEDRTVHFHVLEKGPLERITQHLVDPETGEEVPRDQVRKGYEIERGIYVLLTEDEIEKQQPEESRDIEVSRYVPAAHIDQQWYDRPYYLGPDNGSAPAYFALAEALDREKREGIATWVMRKKEYVGALRSEGGYLVLITLKYAEEVLTADELPSPGGRAPDAKELKMAEQLVAALEDEFRIEDYHDEYRERVMKFINAKAEGKKSALRSVPRKQEPKSLTQSLAASIKIAKRQKEKAVA